MDNNTGRKRANSAPAILTESDRMETRARSNAIHEPNFETRPRSNAFSMPKTRPRSNAFVVTEQDKLSSDRELGITWNHRESTVQQFNALNDGSRRLSDMTQALKDTELYRNEMSYRAKIEKANQGSALSRPFKKIAAWVQKKWRNTEDKKGKARDAIIGKAVEELAPPVVSELYKFGKVEFTHLEQREEIGQINRQLGPEMDFTTKGWKRGADFNRTLDHTKNAISLASTVATGGLDKTIPGAKSGVLFLAGKGAKAIHERGAMVGDMVKDDNRFLHGMSDQDSISKQTYKFSAIRKKQKLDALQSINRSEAASKQTAKKLTGQQ
ncbi:hypothetical protein SG34_014920 [Thalassomonas viridans]|uniref:Uncharacterized protein n=1 Tax=Thalassomonas viridans TaxID=137584 RepID=A0AAF0CCF7_9GAMM|nr:hypothetical protein [Thalassomonas viridans]WDE08071.1 hypothetical protein SG34_014920 [Thalassomonas viridans]